MVEYYNTIKLLLIRLKVLSNVIYYCLKVELILPLPLKLYLPTIPYFYSRMVG